LNHQRGVEAAKGNRKELAGDVIHNPQQVRCGVGVLVSSAQDRRNLTGYYLVSIKDHNLKGRGLFFHFHPEYQLTAELAASSLPGNDKITLQEAHYRFHFEYL